MACGGSAVFVVDSSPDRLTVALRPADRFAAPTLLHIIDTLVPEDCAECILLVFASSVGEF